MTDLRKSILIDKQEVCFISTLPKDSEFKGYFEFEIDVQGAYEKAKVIKIFPYPLFKKYPISPENNDDLIKVLEPLADVLRFQLRLSHSDFIPLYTGEIILHIIEVFSDIERCAQMVEALKAYAGKRNLKYWQLAIVEVIIPILHYNKRRGKPFFEGGIVDLNHDGKNDFEIGPWFSKNNSVIKLNKSRMEKDMEKFLNFYERRQL